MAAELPGARLQGQGQMRFFGLHVYDALLWTTAPLAPADVERSPLALELRYARSLKGPLIAERSIEEMRRQDEIAAADAERWLAAMTRLFPDVGAGDRITGVHRPGQGARFHVNGRLAGEVRDAVFARLFFGIWLSPRTSEPKLRAALLGSR
ncbi:MAG TPA: chalcone isomerase family protein [Burkholderiaceae bacterium]|nr:chalcone isomerase family protein [Burkholderiaceae bacterium]